MNSASAFPDTSLIKEILIQRGLIPSNNDVLLQDLSPNAKRTDAEYKRAFRALLKDETLFHLTVGWGTEEHHRLESLNTALTSFSAACPSISCKPLFFVKMGDLSILGQEFFPGHTLEEAWMQKLIPEKQIISVLDSLRKRLEETFAHSSSAERELELSDLESTICNIEDFNRLDLMLLKEEIFPIIRQGILEVEPRTRWTNGDLIARNIIIGDDSGW
jgi:hypothetical protein